MVKEFIQKMNHLKMTDWISELANEEDDVSMFERLRKAVYKSRSMREHGWSATWEMIISRIENDEYSVEESGPMSAKDVNELINNRVKRES